MVNQTLPDDPLIHHPLPPANFNSVILPTYTIKETFYRLNRGDKSSCLHFDKSGYGRFDGPSQSYGILYAGKDIYASWIETFGRIHGRVVLTEEELKRRNLYKIDIQRHL